MSRAYTPALILRIMFMVAHLVWGGSVAAQTAQAQDLAEFFRAKTPGSTMTIDHAPWAKILKAHLKTSPDGINRFAYGKVAAAEKKALKTYLDALSAVDPASLNDDEQRAFWINFYNALTIDVVLDAYPVKSIREISSGLFSIGPWKKKLVKVKGQDLSLDDIEHGILRKVWSDARIHFAVNCASIGCPNLMAVPFTGKTLDAMLDQGARDYVNHSRGLSFDAKGRIVASSIFDWYGKDFGKTDAEILRYLAKFAEPELKAKLAKADDIYDHAYDWALNEAK